MAVAERSLSVALQGTSLRGLMWEFVSEQVTQSLLE